jgi:hypothetical protein
MKSVLFLMQSVMCFGSYGHKRIAADVWVAAGSLMMMVAKPVPVPVPALAGLPRESASLYDRDVRHVEVMRDTAATMIRAPTRQQHFVQSTQYPS